MNKTPLIGRPPSHAQLPMHGDARITFSSIDLIRQQLQPCVAAQQRFRSAWRLQRRARTAKPIEEEEEECLPSTNSSKDDVTFSDAQGAAVAARARGEHKAAASLFSEAERLARRSSQLTADSRPLVSCALGLGAAECHAAVGDWWSVATLLDVTAIPGMPSEALLLACNLFAMSLLRLGLLHLAAPPLDAAARLLRTAGRALEDSDKGAQYKRLRTEHTARTNVIAASAASISSGGERESPVDARTMEGLRVEISTLEAALGETPSRRELARVEREVTTARGRLRLAQSGLCDEAEAAGSIGGTEAEAIWGSLPAARLFELRVKHRCLLYHVKKRYEHARSTGKSEEAERGVSAGKDGEEAAENGLPPGLGGGSAHCLAPSHLPKPKHPIDGPPLLTARRLQTLIEERVLVIDGAASAKVLEQAASEVRQMWAGGLLTTDPHDACNPRAAAFDMPLWREKVQRDTRGRMPRLDGVPRPTLHPAVAAVGGPRDPASRAADTHVRRVPAWRILSPPS